MKLMIYFSDEQNKVKLTNKFALVLRKAAIAALEHENVGGRCELSITLTDNEAIHELNVRYRNIDRPTDVLSFPQIDFENDGVDKSDDTYKVLGDIVISLEMAQSQAEQIGHSVQHEAAFLCVHSVLHLLGYDHELGEDEEKEMFSKQKEIIEKISEELKEFDD